MKVNSIALLKNNTKTGLNPAINSIKNTNQQNQTEIQRNSLSELMGRSQVNFKGHISTNQNSIKYSNAYMDGLGLGNEDIEFDKQTHEFRFIKLNKRGELSQKLTFNAQTQEQYSKELRQNELGEEEYYETYTKDGELQQESIYSKKGELLYSNVYAPNGTSVEENYDRKLGRVIVREYDTQGNQTDAYVEDIQTRVALISGKAIYEKEVDEKNNTIAYINVYTGYPQKIEYYLNDSFRKLTKTEYYDENDGSIIRSFEKGPHGEIINTMYNENGIVKRKIIDESSLVSVYIDYDENGEKETERIRETYRTNKGKFKPILKKDIFIPGTDIIKETIRYSGKNIYETNYYTDGINAPKETKREFQRDAHSEPILEETVLYYQPTRRKQPSLIDKKIQFTQFEKIEVVYSKKTPQKPIEQYTYDNRTDKLLEERHYYPESGRLRSVTTYGILETVSNYYKDDENNTKTKTIRMDNNDD